MRPRWTALPRLVRFLIIHGALGFVASAALVGVLLGADPGDARWLLLHAAGHWWPALLLWFFAGLTFGGVQIGAAVMLLPAEDRGPRGGVRLPPAPLPARAGLQRRPRTRVVQRCQM
jgi:hypothetical protein